MGLLGCNAIVSWRIFVLNLLEWIEDKEVRKLGIFWSEENWYNMVDFKPSCSFLSWKIFCSFWYCDLPTILTRTFFWDMILIIMNFFFILKNVLTWQKLLMVSNSTFIPKFIFEILLIYEIQSLAGTTVRKTYFHSSRFLWKEHTWQQRL